MRGLATNHQYRMVDGVSPSKAVLRSRQNTASKSTPHTGKNPPLPLCTQVELSVGRPPLGLAGIGYLQKRCCHHLVTVLQPAISHLRVRRSCSVVIFPNSWMRFPIAQKEVISLPDLFHKCLALGFLEIPLGFRSTVNRNHMPVFQNWLYSIGNASGTRPVADFPQGRGSVLVFGGSVYFFVLLIFFQTVPADVKATSMVKVFSSASG